MDDTWKNPRKVGLAVTHLYYIWNNTEDDNGAEHYDKMLKRYSKEIGCTEYYLLGLMLDFSKIMDIFCRNLKMPWNYPEHMGFMIGGNNCVDLV